MSCYDLVPFFSRLSAGRVVCARSDPLWVNRSRYTPASYGIIREEIRFLSVIPSFLSPRSDLRHVLTVVIIDISGRQ